MSPLRTYWDAERGWTVDTPIALSRAQATRVVAWILKVQTDRVLAMHGERREQATAALRALSPDTLHQNLLHTRQEGVLYTK